MKGDCSFKTQSLWSMWQSSDSAAWLGRDLKLPFMFTKKALSMGMWDFPLANSDFWERWNLSFDSLLFHTSQSSVVCLCPSLKLFQSMPLPIHLLRQGLSPKAHRNHQPVHSTTKIIFEAVPGSIWLPIWCPPGVSGFPWALYRANKYQGLMA